MEFFVSLMKETSEQFGFASALMIGIIGAAVYLGVKVINSHRKERELALEKHYQKIEQMEQRHRDERDKDQEMLLKVIHQNSNDNKNLTAALNGLEAWLKASARTNK